MEKTICELFAGIGGFRIGFERLNSGWKTVWFSQWEPSKKKQWAHDCYVNHFGDCVDKIKEYHTGEDISTVIKENIPDHNLLVGGFPCQDYSVAHSLNSKDGQGIEGKKGVLWWQINDILNKKNPKFCLFENVDRLLKSPAKQRGRDFGIILACLQTAGYNVEWRIINAADYGNPQRRKRVFIFAFRKDTKYSNDCGFYTPNDVLLNYGFFAKAFPVQIENLDENNIKICNMFNANRKTILDVSNNFIFDFKNSGLLYNNIIISYDVKPKIEDFIPLKSVMEHNVDEKYYIPENKLLKWKYLKGAKKIQRFKNGSPWIYSEGPIAYPDDLNKPARTMLTSEGTLNRCSHILSDLDTGKYRILTPIEAERIQGFDDNWTNTGMPEKFRYFCMGNALVVPLITRMGKVLDRIFDVE